jgi:cysteine desulfurase
MKTPIYLDYNASTPVDPEVMEAMTPYFREHFGNPSSAGHSFGWMAEEAAEIGREQVADLLGAKPKEIIFTSSATEAVNLGIKGAARVYGKDRNQIITVATEHKAVLETCRALRPHGFEVTELPVHPDGSVDLEALEEALSENTLLVAVMWANNEIGTVHPIQKVADRARAYGALVFTDATQGIGKVSVTVDSVDMLACSGHKFYAPKGVGALYVSRKSPRVNLEPLHHGGGHENGLRSGTLNVPGIVGLGKAAERAGECRADDAARWTRMRDKLETALLDDISGVQVNGPRENRLPQTLNVSFEDLNVNDLLTRLRDVAVSAGSACQSANPTASHVLKAIGLSDEEAFGSIRVSLGRFTTEEEVDYAIDRITEAVEEVRSMPKAMRGQLT